MSPDVGEHDLQVAVPVEITHGRRDVARRSRHDSRDIDRPPGQRTPVGPPGVVSIEVHDYIHQTVLIEIGQGRRGRDAVGVIVQVFLEQNTFVRLDHEDLITHRRNELRNSVLVEIADGVRGEVHARLQARVKDRSLEGRGPEEAPVVVQGMDRVDARLRIEEGDDDFQLGVAPVQVRNQRRRQGHVAEKLSPADSDRPAAAHWHAARIEQMDLHRGIAARAVPADQENDLHQAVSIQVICHRAAHLPEPAGRVPGELPSCRPAPLPGQAERHCGKKEEDHGREAARIPAEESR